MRYSFTYGFNKSSFFINLRSLFFIDTTNVKRMEQLLNHIL